MAVSVPETLALARGFRGDNKKSPVRTTGDFMFTDPENLFGRGAFGSFFSVEFHPFFIGFVFGRDRALGAFGDANTAFDARIGINHQLGVGVAHRPDRTNGNATHAFDAGIINNRGHFLSPKEFVK